MPVYTNMSQVVRFPDVRVRVPGRICHLQYEIQGDLSSESLPGQGQGTWNYHRLSDARANRHGDPLASEFLPTYDIVGLTYDIV